MVVEDVAGLTLWREVAVVVVGKDMWQQPLMSRITNRIYLA
jgi:hypothetical protein